MLLLLAERFHWFEVAVCIRWGIRADRSGYTTFYELMTTSVISELHATTKQSIQVEFVMSGGF